MLVIPSFRCSKIMFFIGKLPTTDFRTVMTKNLRNPRAGPLLSLPLVCECMFGIKFVIKCASFSDTSTRFRCLINYKRALLEMDANF